MQQQPLIIAALAAFAGALVILLIYHLAVVRPALRRARTLLALHDDALGGIGGAATGRFDKLERTVSAQGGHGESLAKRVNELETLAQADLSRVGFLRYDAFDDTGSELSYALALLSRDGNGVVLTSIYSRTDTRTYAKAVEDFTPLSAASEEELEAITLARGRAKGKAKARA
jgi:uncharacterized protein DUF4446